MLIQSAQQYNRNQNCFPVETTGQQIINLSPEDSKITKREQMLSGINTFLTKTIQFGEMHSNTHTQHGGVVIITENSINTKSRPLSTKN